MEVLNEMESLLTNFEVFQLLKDERKYEGQLPKQLRCKPLNTILFELDKQLRVELFELVRTQAHKYLKTLPAATQQKDYIENIIPKLASYKLTSAEILQLINLRPTTATEVQLIVEECEERLKTEEQLNALTETIVECLPPRLEPCTPKQ